MQIDSCKNEFALLDGFPFFNTENQGSVIVEPGTSCIRSRNHTPRPLSHMYESKKYYVSCILESIFQFVRRNDRLRVCMWKKMHNRCCYSYFGKTQITNIGIIKLKHLTLFNFRSIKLRYILMIFSILKTSRIYILYLKNRKFHCHV